MSNDRRPNGDKKDHDSNEELATVAAIVVVAIVLGALALSYALWLVGGVLVGLLAGVILAHLRVRIARRALVTLAAVAIALGAVVGISSGRDWVDGFHHKLVDKTATELRNDRRHARYVARTTGSKYVEPDQHGLLAFGSLNYGRAFGEDWSKQLLLAIAPLLFVFSIAYFVPDRRLRLEEAAAAQKITDELAAEAAREAERQAEKDDHDERTRRAVEEALEARERRSEDF